VASQTPHENLLSEAALVERLASIRSSLDRVRAEWGESGELTLDSGLSFDGREPIEVTVRKRGRRYDIGDEAGAVSAAGQPRGWFELAERLMAEVGLNVNRRGVVFVGTVYSEELDSLAVRVGDRSLAVYEALLELDGA
jgi:hypothetical protein